jgi:hypothetical protein
MKKIILTAVLSAASLGAFAQGTIDVGNFLKGTFVQPIYSPNPSNTTVEQIGSPASSSYAGGGTPVGSTVYGGTALQAGYDMVFLYSTTGGTDPRSMTVGTTVPFQTAATPNARPSGTMAELVGFSVPTAAGNTTINWAFGAFSTEGGTVTSWAQALAAFNGGADPNAQIGWGSTVTATLLAGNGNLAEPNTFSGWTSFSLMGEPVPEPSTIALAGLGAAGLLLFRRRRK